MYAKNWKLPEVCLLARIGVRTTLEQAYGKLRTAFLGQRKLVEGFLSCRTPREESHERRFQQHRRHLRLILAF
jgi:hypothetical protein